MTACGSWLALLSMTGGVLAQEADPGEVTSWLRDLVPEALREVTFLLETWVWLGLVAVAFLGLVMDRLVQAVLALVSARLLRREHVSIEPGMVTASLRPFGLLAMALVWMAGLRCLVLPDQALTVLSVAVQFVAAAAGVWGFYRLVDILAEAMGQWAATTESRLDDLLVPLVRKTAKVFIGAFGLVFLADNLDIEISSLLTGLGLGGIAFALAAQDLLKNLFGSLMVILDRSFQVGDWVVIGDIEGTVEEVGFRSTRVRTFYDSRVTLPNANLISGAVDNYGSRRYRRWKTLLSIAYDTPPDRIEAFCEGIRELVRRHPYTRKDYYHVYLNAFAAASLDVLVYIFHRAPDWGTELRERHRMMADILRLAERLGVEFAFPTQTLYLRREAGPARAADTAMPGPRPGPGAIPSGQPAPGSPRAESSEAALLRGREAAHDVLQATRDPDGGRPPPVVIRPPSPDND